MKNSIQDIISEILTESDFETFKNKYPEVDAEFASAKTYEDLKKIKKKYYKLADDAEPGSPGFGAVEALYKNYAEPFKASNSSSDRSLKDARADQILRTRNSDGKAKSRKW